MAIRDSVTVSIALDSSGTSTLIRLDTRERVVAPLGTTSLSPGSSSTSSYVRPTVAKGSCAAGGDGSVTT